MENSGEIIKLLKSIQTSLTAIVWILAFGLAIAFNAGYRAGVFGWLWSN